MRRFNHKAKVESLALENIELFPTPSRRKAVDADQVRHFLANSDVDMFSTFVTGAPVVSLEPPIKEIRTKVGSMGTSLSEDKSTNPRFADASLAKIPPRLQKENQQINLRQVVVTVSPINRGDVIQRDQLTLAPSRGTWNEHWVTDMDQIIGMEASRSYSPMRPLLIRDFQKAIVVRRNSECKIVSKIGSVTVSTTGKAKKDGAIGDIVQVQSLDRKRTYFGKVTAPQTVTVSN